MSIFQVQKSESVLSKRRVSLAAVAAFLGCAACCAFPLLAATELGSGVVGALMSVFRPGAELLVGGSAFVIALGIMAARSRFSRDAAAGCGTACASDGRCCERGTTPRSP